MGAARGIEGLEGSLYRYRVPLSGSGSVARLPDPRTGWLIRLRAQGAEAWGEVAPLPGHSPDDPARCERELVDQLALLERDGFSPDGDGWVVQDGSPALRFGLESARCALAAQLRGTTVGALLGGPKDPPPLSLNALLAASSGEACLEEVDRALAFGFRCLKMKVGRSDPREEAVWVRRVRERIAGRARVRLDANRAWTFEQAVAFMEQVGAAGIDYLEEPLADPSALPDLLHRGLLPVALDESLVTMSALPEGLAAVVLKPTLLGGYAVCRTWAEQALGRGAVPVVSAMFESGVGLRAVARLAAAVAPPGTAAGLDTRRCLSDDLLAFPWPEKDAILDMQALEEGPEAPVMKQLEPLGHG